MEYNRTLASEELDLFKLNINILSLEDMVKDVNKEINKLDTDLSTESLKDVYNTIVSFIIKIYNKIVEVLKRIVGYFTKSSARLRAQGEKDKKSNKIVNLKKTLRELLGPSVSNEGLFNLTLESSFSSMLSSTDRNVRIAIYSAPESLDVSGSTIDIPLLQFKDRIAYLNSFLNRESKLILDKLNKVIPAMSKYLLNPSVITEVEYNKLAVLEELLRDKYNLSTVLQSLFKNKTNMLSVTMVNNGVTPDKDSIVRSIDYRDINSLRNASMFNTINNSIPLCLITVTKPIIENGVFKEFNNSSAVIGIPEQALVRAANNIANKRLIDIQKFGELEIDASYTIEKMKSTTDSIERDVTHITKLLSDGIHNLKRYEGYNIITARKFVYLLESAKILANMNLSYVRTALNEVSKYVATINEYRKYYTDDNIIEADIE